MKDCDGYRVTVSARLGGNPECRKIRRLMINDLVAARNDLLWGHSSPDS